MAKIGLGGKPFASATFSSGLSLYGSHTRDDGEKKRDGRHYCRRCLAWRDRKRQNDLSCVVSFTVEGRGEVGVFVCVASGRFHECCVNSLSGCRATVVWMCVCVSMFSFLFFLLFLFTAFID